MARNRIAHTWPLQSGASGLGKRQRNIGQQAHICYGIWQCILTRRLAGNLFSLRPVSDATKEVAGR